MRDQIAKLAEAQDIYNADFAQKNWMAVLSAENAFAVIVANTDFAAILAEFDRLSKIEAAARELHAVLDEGYGHCPHCDGDHAANDQDKAISARAADLDAALDAKGQP